MTPRYDTPPRKLLLLGLLGLLLAPLGGCDFLVGDPTPNEARIVLSGSGDEPVFLTLSKDFLAARSEAGRMTVEILESDTMTVTPPFERTVDIRDEQQFFAQARAADSVDTNVQVRVFLDGELRYDETQNLLQVPLQFLYLFNRPVLADVEVL